MYKMVMFFNNCIDMLQRLCSVQSEHERAHGHRGSRHERGNVEESEYAVNKYLARMLAEIASGLDWNIHQPGHSDLLEGMLFSVFKHTGRLLSEAVFAEHVAISDNPGNVTKNMETPEAVETNFETRYIVQVLHAALGGSKRKDLVSHVLATGKTTVLGNPGLGGSAGLSLSGDMLLKARKLLQSTLVKSAVGGADLEALRLPTPPVEDSEVFVQTANADRCFGPEWVVETLWGLIGWDLVA